MCFKKVVKNRPAPSASSEMKSKNGSKANKEVEFPVKPVTIQVVQTARGTMNHSYRDFSKVPPQEGYECPKSIEEMTFSQKVHHILSQEAYENWICWMPHGRAFKVHVPVLFETQVCPKYFGHKRYSSFLRELNNYGFKHISKGIDRNCYYHEFMLRDRPHLCQYMPKRKDARRLQVDPDNEPNFYSISKQYPLGSETSTSKETEIKSSATEGQGASMTTVSSANLMTATPYAALSQPMLAPAPTPQQTQPQPPTMMTPQPQGVLAAPPVANISFSNLPANVPGAANNGATSLLLALLEQKRKEDEEQRQRASALLQLFQQQQQQPQAQAFQLQQQAPAQSQQQQQPDVSALLGFLNQHLH